MEVCEVCDYIESEETNKIVKCGKCGLIVHRLCYNELATIDFMCDFCRSGKKNEEKKCILCPQKSGAMKKTGNGKWAHIKCALFIPEVIFKDEHTMSPILCSKIKKKQYGQKCSICANKEGVCIKCQICANKLHVTCGQRNGLLVEVEKKDIIEYVGYCMQHINSIVSVS